MARLSLSASRSSFPARGEAVLIILATPFVVTRAKVDIPTSAPPVSAAAFLFLIKRSLPGEIPSQVA